MATLVTYSVDFRHRRIQVDTKRKSTSQARFRSEAHIGNQSKYGCLGLPPFR